MRPVRSRPRRRGTAALALTLMLALVAAWFPAGPAQAGSSLKAITALKSKVSSLRTGPDGKPLTEQQRAAAVGAASGALGSSDLMGTPADKTILRSQDQVLRDTNTSGVGQGNQTAVSSYGLKPDMSGVDGVPTDIPSGARATIDHRYPSVHGNFLTSTQESVLQFKSTVAGADSIYQLGTANAVAEKRKFDDAADDIDLANGGTYVFKTGGNTAVTNASARGSGPADEAAQLLPMLPAVEPIEDWTPPYAQQWAVVPTSGAYQLISRTDGLCLVHTADDASAEVTTAECNPDPSRLWWINDGGVPHLWRFQPTSDYGGPGLYGDGTSLKIGDDEYWEAHEVNEPGGSVPTWSTVRANGYVPGNMAAPYAMAAGDLDGVATTDAVEKSAGFHDEAVVLYTDSDDRWQMRVVDYNATPGHLLVTAPDPSVTAAFGRTGLTENGVWNPGDLVVEVGDFNGDGRNEIATGAQGDDFHFVWTFWKYVTNTDGSRTLQTLTGLNELDPFQATTNITGQQGYADSAVGDFDGDGRDDIALAYANNVPTTTANSGRKVNLGVWTLNTDLSTRSVAITSPTMDDGDLSPSMVGDVGRTPSGIQLVAGNLLSDPDNGFGPQRSELAVAWSGYSVGTHVVDQEGHDQHPYKITPVVNIYKMDKACTSGGGLCPTNEKVSPTDPDGKPTQRATPLFPTNPSATAYRRFGTGYDIPPVSLEVGAFGGSDDGNPPVDGLLASAWLESDGDPSNGSTDGKKAFYTQQSIVVPWAKDGGPGATWTTADSRQQLDTSNWVLRRSTSYDGLGTSLVLGAPAVMDIEQRVTENLVAAEPPTHVDWLNGGWSNISASSAFNLQTQTTSANSFTSLTNTQNTWQNGTHEGLDAKVSWSENVGMLPAEKGYVDVNTKFSKAWSGLSGNSTSNSTSWTTSAQAKTDQDDDFSYSLDDTRLYRYPVLGSAGTFTGTGKDCTSGCRSSYDVYVPKGSATFSSPGKNTVHFSPSWQNMNALSYPAVDGSAANPVPTPDLGSYSYTDASGAEQSVTSALYNQVNTVSGNSGALDLKFDTAKGAGQTTTHARTWTVGTDVTVSGTVSVGLLNIGADEASLSLTGTAGFDVTKATSGTQTGTSSTSSDQEFQINYPAIGAGRSYQIGTAYYYAEDGAAKVVHGVDLTDSPQGSTWWRTNYGRTPDPALNLPGRIELTPDPATGVDDNPLWLTEPQRQLIRGFQVLQASSDGSGLDTSGDPYTINPKAGEAVTFQVPVHNYSLIDMTAGTTAHFYAVPVDDHDIAVTGDAIDLGTQEVPAIKAQQEVLVQAPAWTAVSNTTNTLQRYRIVVRLDEDGTAADMHPLAGSACPTTTLEPNDNNTGDPALYDVMKSGDVAETLGCGQNNQGYGTVHVSPKAGVGAERHATSTDTARAQLAGGGLVDGDSAHLELTEKSDVPTIPVGQRITGLVHATSEVHTNDHPTVAIYDGPVADGKIVAVTQLGGIDDQTGGHASFSWTPDEPGLHELHQVLLGTKATGEDDEQIMRVMVAEPKDQYTVTAASSASWVKSGRPFTISGKVTPVPSSAVARTVALQREVDGQWTEVENQQTSSRGAYSFDLRGGRTGTYSYRVVKLPTAGREAAASPTLTVRVQNAFTVTAEAEPTSVKTRRAVTFTGTVTPPPAARGDRIVQLEVRSGARWKTVTTGRTTSTGGYTLEDRPTRTGTYTYRVTKRATRLLPAASSKPVTIKVTRR